MRSEHIASAIKITFRRKTIAQTYKNKDKLDGEWWNKFRRLQNCPISTLVFLRKILLAGALIYINWSACICGQ